jgi:hypothetical protein
MMMSSAGGTTQVINHPSRLKINSPVVPACPETVEVSIISPTLELSPASLRNTTTPTSMYPLTPGTPSFMRGTRIQVRCTTISYPEASLTMSIPGLNLNTPEWQNLTESAGDRGYTRRTLEAYFTLDGSDELLRGALTVDCRSSVANGTCANTNSLALQVLVPQTSKAVKLVGFARDLSLFSLFLVAMGL